MRTTMKARTGSDSQPSYIRNRKTSEAPEIQKCRPTDQAPGSVDKDSLISPSSKCL